jgi:hypothetical protein
MAPRTKNRFWRLCGIYFRRFRITLLFVIFILVSALVYLDQVGLPGFVKKPLLQKLRDRGLDLQFTRLRWRWYHGIIAENVVFGRTDQPTGPQITAQQVQVRLDNRALLRLQFQVNSLIVKQGRFTWPIAETNTAPRELSVSDIQTELQLLPGDVWKLDNFQASFAGAGIQLSGAITNASAVRDWKLLQPKEPASPGELQRQLRNLADTLERIHFDAPPQLTVDVRGDVRAPQTFAVLLGLHAPGADTPWGKFQHGSLSMLLRPATSNVMARAEINLLARGAQTEWASATNLVLAIRLQSHDTDTNLVRCALELTAATADTRWAQATNLSFTAQWLHAITNPIPISGHGELQADDARTQWGAARQVRLAGTLSPSTNVAAPPETSWGWWTNLVPYALEWEGQLRGLTAQGLEMDEVFCSGQWHAPELALTRISCALYGGRFDSSAGLNVTTRELSFNSESNFDGQRLSPLFTDAGKAWLAQYSWNRPPVAKARGSVVLPPWPDSAWTNLASAEWRADVLPTVRLEGEFHVTDGGIRGVSFSSADAHYIYSNQCWQLPDLVAVRPEGRLELSQKANELTQEFYFRVHSTIDIRAFRPLLPSDAQTALDIVGLTQPPIIDAEAWGRWNDSASLGLKGNVTLTNFTFRNESVSDFQTALEYTNKVLTLLQPRLHRGTQRAEADGVKVDFVAGKVFLTNGFSTTEPMVVARAIGPLIIRAIEPYQFLEPPTARVYGTIPLVDDNDADLHFEVSGGPFEWWRFRVPHVAGKVDWVGKRVDITDVLVNFYRGSGAGDAHFDFSRGNEPDFSLDFAATGADLHLLMEDLRGQTNRLEGQLTVRLTLTQANTADRQSWQGSGHAELRDGLIWDFPIFGIFSPVLDGISPGLGESRAKEGSASFVITNGVIRTDDLMIHASLMRLRYWGSLDTNNRLEARAQADLFRDTMVMGKFLSLALWPVSKVFEYKITGSMREPKAEPVFIVPRILFMPFHAPRPPDYSQTNTPSIFP